MITSLIYVFVKVIRLHPSGELVVLLSKPKLYSTLLYTQKFKRREGKADVSVENETVRSY